MGNKILLTIYISLFSSFVFSQTLNIQKNDGTVLQVELSFIDSITITTHDGIPCPGLPIINYNGKSYNTVLIGDQCWLKENLNVGIMISSNNKDDDQKNNFIFEKYCYNNLPWSCNAFGGLYQWNEAMQYSTTEGTRGICPDGWHIPTNTDFETLKYVLGNDGNTLKAIGQGTDHGEGTNTSGFSALLAGGRYTDGSFSGTNNNTYYWSSSVSTGGDPYYIRLDSDNDFINFKNDYSTDHGFSIRCLRD